LPANRSFFLWPRAIDMHFLPPVTIMPGDTAESLKEKLFALMTDYYLKKGK
jgi:1-acyl-sn-glycerol-3-phosphate acyltransferase